MSRAGVWVAAIASWLGASFAATAEGPRELTAGGMMLVPDYALTLDVYELSLARDEVRATYTIRNTSSDRRTILLTLALPDIDALGLSEQAPNLPSADPVNFIGVSYSVDGVVMLPRFEQRAMVLGLDVTQDLLAAALPLFPLGADVPQRLGRLPDALRTDFAERGIVRIDDDKVLPSWTLKTVAYWRQTYAPEKQVTAVLSYRPVTGAPRVGQGSVDSLRRSHCLDAAAEAELIQRGSQVAPGAASPFTTVGFALTVSASWPPKAGTFRLLVRKSSPSTLVATCRKGLLPVGPTVFEWIAKDFYPDEDIGLLFVQ